MTLSRSLLLMLTLAACSSAPLGRPPEFSPQDYSPVAGEAALRDPLPLPPAMAPTPLPARAASNASLWTGDRGSLLGDNRAMERGDILTVVIEIDDSAEMSNSTDQGRQGSESMGVDALFGLEALDGQLAGGAGLSPGVDISSDHSFSGQGSVSRNEQLELLVAATVTEVLPNGVLAISGSQEVRVNNELRELLVSGYVRRADISRQNEVTYDKIAQARISYGGRGQITDMQQPRIGQQAVDGILPF